MVIASGVLNLSEDIDPKVMLVYTELHWGWNIKILWSRREIWVGKNTSMQEWDMQSTPNFTIIYTALLRTAHFVLVLASNHYGMAVSAN
jgi:hypothetical protein